MKRSALNLEDGEKHLKHFMTLKPIKTAIEIGTFRGLTSAVMSQYCDKLITIDLAEGLIEDYSQRFDWAKTPKRQELWQKLGITNIELMLVTDNEVKKQILNGIDYDFVFIDGDHTFEGAKFDFELTKRCGRVLFHDYDRCPGKEAPVRDFIDTIKEGKMQTTKDYAYWEDK
jgi:hypothetical protein